MRTIRPLLLLAALAAVVAGCDLIEPPTNDGPPASMNGTWSTGDVEVTLDTTFALAGDPTYQSVQIVAEYSLNSELDLEDTAGDVRGYVRDYQWASVEIGYLRHDGVTVRDVTEANALGDGSSPVEAVYVPPRLTLTGFLYPMNDFAGLALDFSDGTARMSRRLAVPVRLGRLDQRLVTLVRPSFGTTFRRVEDNNG